MSTPTRRTRILYSRVHCRTVSDPIPDAGPFAKTKPEPVYSGDVDVQRDCGDANTPLQCDANGHQEYKTGEDAFTQSETLLSPPQNPGNPPPMSSTEHFPTLQDAAAVSSQVPKDSAAANGGFAEFLRRASARQICATEIGWEMIDKWKVQGHIEQEELEKLLESWDLMEDETQEIEEDVTIL